MGGSDALVKLLALIDKLLGEPADEVRRSHANAIRELQSLPCIDFKVIRGVVLPDGVPVAIAHKLGRPPIWVAPSIPRGGVGAGVIFQYTDAHPSTGAPVDQTQVVLIAAFAYGGTIKIDLAVA
jgi:hypothetical protein